MRLTIEEFSVSDDGLLPAIEVTQNVSVNPLGSGIIWDLSDGALDDVDGFVQIDVVFR